ncbi:hypothetical protein SISNIDRAFT_482185 [Sistotremastrum niveocremeum HHB9708]|uniref:Fungal-type protein kinase domain-containing protein n=1 Tax=Sistotremastrum niveocremeum HHB9708 TaxID=1314777 RepID=A0A164YUS7_9AGAM|nr:hypothetical protein SISNIDRAFT_482185 [Sistotremastrum niveocremeum HHB9708]
MRVSSELASTVNTLLLESVDSSESGHRNIFDDAWLHRDVSIGNIMILKHSGQRRFVDLGEKVAEEAPELFEGVLHDADHAISSWDIDNIRSEYRSGTLLYMSIRVLKNWIESDDSEDVPSSHSALDDLESFVWVMTHMIIYFVKAKATTVWLRQLGSQNRADLLGFKRGIESGILENLSDSRPSAMTPFYPYLARLFTLANEGATVARTLGSSQSQAQLTEQQIRDTCRDLYRRYSEIIIEAAEILPASWN